MNAILALISEVSALEPDLAAAYNTLTKFLATGSGQNIEAALGKLFHLTATPGAAVVVEPKAAKTSS